MKTRFVLLSLILGACSADAVKEDGKGQVDDSEPPSIPAAHGKADDAAKLVAVDIHSPHPYANDVDKAFAVPLQLPACAKTARLHFKVLRTEKDYDFVSVAGETFTGDRDNTWTAWFTKSGASVDVRLDTDGSITRHGFEIDKIEWDGQPTGCAPVASCGAGTVNLAKRAGVCECPAPSVCAPIANIVVSHQLWRGYNNTTKTAQGGTALFTHPGTFDQPVTETVGTVDTAALAALVRRAADTGVLQGAGYDKAVPPGAFTDRFTIKAGTYALTFVAGKGSHTAAVQSLVDEFEALFSCEGASAGLACGSGLVCEENACIEDQSCACSAQFDPQCGVDGHTYSNACAAGCANAAIAHAGECGTPGDFCGGMQGLACSGDNRCRYGASTFSAPHPDAGGTCVARTYCDAPADCNGLAHPAVPGAWACETTACAWKAGVQWKTAGHFETANPYGNGQSVWHELTLPAEAQAMRLVASRFRLENTYDKLEVWTWNASAWTRVKTYTGTAGPTAVDEFPGRFHYLRFVSDSSVTDLGVSLDAEWR